MAEVLLFHHAQGLTPGVLAFADEFRRAGHTVHTPDLYHGQTFETLDEGLAYAKEVGFDTLCENGVRVADELPAELVYAGFSLGGMPAQKLAQTRPGRGVLLFHSSITPEVFGSAWPADVPVQIHTMDADPLFMGEGGDIEAARQIVAAAADGQLFLYPGDKHLFTDSSLPSYDADATALVTRRTLEFLADR
jgi:dienelactone hydrolase